MHTVLSRSRPYWFGAVLLGIAATLLAVGFTAKHAGAVVVAGFGFIGAGVTKLADVAQEQGESRHRDRDETRRVSYMVLLCDRTDHYELAATAVNALVHHGLAVNREEATANVLALVERGGDPSGKSRRWLEGQINRITDELGS